MRRPERLLYMFILSNLFCVAFSYMAYAYLDLGSGSYIFQVLIAFLLGTLFAVKVFRYKIKIFFKNLSSRLKKIGKS